MSGFLSPGAVHVIVTVAAITLAIDLLAAVLFVRDMRRRAARRALDRVTVPDAATAMRGKPYRGLQDRLLDAMQAGRR